MADDVQPGFDTNFVVTCSSLAILVINPTLVDQQWKHLNLMKSNELLDIWLQSPFKLHTLRHLSSHNIVMRTNVRKLLKISHIISNIHICLLRIDLLVEDT